MEVSSLLALRELNSGIALGWTVPKVTRDWNSMPWARPLVAGGLISLRARLPGVVRRRARRASSDDSATTVLTVRNVRGSARCSEGRNCER